jgi:glycosyltransferase involved in cell wall biosynthesis
MQPFFTIITASLNRGGTIRNTLESIRKQTSRNYEHIIVDGCSTDDTLNIIKEYSAVYPMKWISEPDRGVPDAFNKALKLSSGEYVIAIQADDYLLDESVLAKVHAVISRGKLDIYSFPIMKEQATGGARRIDPIRHLWWIRFRNIFPHQGVFVNRKLFDTIGYYDTRYTITEDYDFLYRALNAGASVSFEDFPVAYMGGAGPCSLEDYLPVRLQEENRLQSSNEKNLFWRVMQKLFWLLYYPYKIHIAVKLPRTED